MEQGKHLEYIREVPGSKTAVLFIHGILGTPNHFARLVDAVPDEWAVYNILLEGHGRTVEDFASATMEQWKTQVRCLVLKLSDEYDNIIVVAHSMGTLFAIEEAVRNPKIKKLFLYLALLAEIGKTRKMTARINVPCFVFQSKKDELVAISSVKYFRENPWMRCGLLVHSVHFYYEESDMAYVMECFKRVCKNQSEKICYT